MGDFQRQYAPLPYLVERSTRFLANLLSPSLRRLEPAALMHEIAAQSGGLDRLTESRLREKFHSLKNLEPGSPPRVAGAFAMAREAIRRRLGIRLYDVQMLGGLALVRGRIAEMATGEGKTLTVVPPAAYFGLAGCGVHVATVNSYLAERDHEETRPVFDLLGLESALLPERAPAQQKRRAYEADITYGVGHEFGFDYLRDQTALHAAGGGAPGESFFNSLTGRQAGVTQLAQRPLAVALVDEADSIMIDEALTPLLLSGAKGKVDPDGARACQFAAQVAELLVEDEDYSVDHEARSVTLLPSLEERLICGERRLSPAAVGIPASALRRSWPGYLRNALMAAIHFKRDIHYMVADGKIVMVDESTGRACPDRSWREGLHQAIEAKEGVEITDEGVPMSSISRQRFYRLYPILAGMTGTAMESAGEFWQSYRLRVEKIPLNRPSLLKILPQRTFQTWEQKVEAITADVIARHAAGQPVLVGTRDIGRSEMIAARIKACGIPFRLLNARQDKEEAEIISAAGQRGAVTIATNMAGRGAHIPLGNGVADLGGLHVICSERHESVRIDRQLLGRAARQGQPGSGQCFCSLEDELFKKYRKEAGPPPSAEPVNDGGELPAHALQAYFNRLQSASEAALYRRRRLILHQQEWNEETRGKM